MSYDIVIVGAGPAGYSGALKAARSGKKVTLVEMDRAGGTCLNRGCIPTKALRHAADVLAMTQKAADFGVLVENPEFDFSAAAKHRDGVTETLVSGVEKLLKSAKVDLVRGRGKLIAPGKVEVETKQGLELISGDDIVLAAGAKPCDIPGIAIDELIVVSSEGALKWNELPGSLLVIGGGVIGCEFADIMAAMGVDVTVVEVMERILLYEDRQVAKAVQKSLEARGVKFRLGVKVDGLQVDDGGAEMTLAGGEVLKAEKVIVSVGRKPAVEEVGAKECGLEIENGAVRVDPSGRTSLPGVWAAGDLIGPPMLAHAASHEMEVVIDNILGKKRSFEREAMPSVVFVSPEVASVGLLEDKAKSLGAEVEVGRFSYQASGKALCAREPEGMAKVVAEKGGGGILGATVMGAHASDLIAELTLAVKNRLTVNDLVETIHAHPTLSEIVLEAAADTMGMAVHKAGRPRR